MEKFQISVKNSNNLLSFIEIYAVFVLNLCGEKSLWRKMTNMRSAYRGILSTSSLTNIFLMLPLSKTCLVEMAFPRRVLPDRHPSKEVEENPTACVERI